MEKAPELELGAHIFAAQHKDGSLVFYQTVEELAEDTEDIEDEIVAYQLYVYRKITFQLAT